VEDWLEAMRVGRSQAAGSMPDTAFHKGRLGQ
jgi:hypothetical protein